jgi:acyl carrier protein
MTNPHDSDQTEERIKDFIAQNLLYSTDGFPYSEDASFLQEGIIDSLGVMHLVEFIQTSFHLAVDQREVIPDNFDSVSGLARFIRKKQQAQAPSPTP